jgi:predicted ATP-binding protein involved in virulence
MGLPNARIGIGLRGSPGRLAIVADGPNGQVRLLAPSLNHLSSGQAVLLSLFTTILRYADMGGTRTLPDITGIAVVDELDTHLHPTHQLEVLPRLMRLFPRIQFVLSTHSPLVLLGLAREFGDDGLDIIDLPSGQVTRIEAFSEFQVAFDAFRRTRALESQVASAASASDAKGARDTRASRSA